MRYYCTLFDINYLPNFLSLYHSLERQNEKFKIYAFCMDTKSFEFFKTYPVSMNYQVVNISLDSLIHEFPILLKIKKDRSLVEFYFTCTPFIASFIIKKEVTASHITYLDSDLFFYDSPEKIFDEIGNASIGIIEHKFFGIGRKYLKYGIYNVGWVTFKNDEVGNRCLSSWKDKCEEWCFDFYDESNNRFGDQKYLDSWIQDFVRVKVINQKGANLAPWNVGQYKIKSSHIDKLTIDSDPLVFYHFASFKSIGESLYTTNISRYYSRPSQIIKDKIYQPYINSISKYSRIVNENKVLLIKKREILSGNFTKIFYNIYIKTLRLYFNDYIKFNNK